MNTNDAIIASSQGAMRLTDWALLRAHGADVEVFLQGQLTQDVAALPLGVARLSGYCSAKGRLLASFIIWRMADDAFGLLCSADVAAAVRKRLSMYVLRARCRIDDVSNEWALHGIVGAAVGAVAGGVAPGAARHDGAAWSIGMPPAEQLPRALYVQPASEPAPQAAPLDPSVWAWLEVSSGVPRITAATVEQFVPQMINFELVGGVHFQKGCYPGQEVVARSQYRGTIKRRMHLFATSGDAHPGQEVFHSGDASQPAGLVVNAAPNPARDGHRLLAEVKLTSLGTGSLHLARADGPVLQQLELPYPIADTADV